MKNILEMLEADALLYPDKVAFSDSNISYTYKEIMTLSKRTGSALLPVHGGSPVAVLMPRGADCLAAAFGVVYSGVPYVILDSEMPAERIDIILKTLCPGAVIVSDDCKGKAAQLKSDCAVVNYADAVLTNVEDAELEKVRSNMTESDVLYILFTSGSTDKPKGCAVSHRNVIAYTKWYSTEFGINEHTVFGSQTPFYFSMSVSDVFSTLRCGASMHIIEKKYFSFPIKLVELLNEHKVNTLYWVPSAMSIIANWRVFDYAVPKYLTKVLFAGEVMPQKQLNYWRRVLPTVMYANLFGPTETTDICTYYVVDREFDDTETLPIGKACDNCNVFAVNENGALCKPGEEGELYVRGPFVALGYYNDPERTAASFVQNPLNRAYPEKVYRTGDIVRENEHGELEYVSRRDFQIKRRGYRIELGEIEAAAGAAEGVSSAACIWCGDIDKLVVVYSGKASADDVRQAVIEKVPIYMQPDKVEKIRQMPYNQNGKIDRKNLLERFGNKNG